jgi:Flp pilus assembly protein TadG
VRKKGSFTIEAALVMPFLLFAVLILMQISFFLYNREAVTVIASQAALKGVQMEQEGKNLIQKELHSFIKKETDEKLLFIDEINWDISVSLTKVKVKVFISQNTLFKRLRFEIKKEMSRINPASLLWEAERWRK